VAKKSSISSDLKERLKKIDKIKTELKKAEKNATKEIMGLLKDLMAQNPLIEGVRWTQYTPHFNDGEECIFGVNNPEFKFNLGAPSKAEDEDDHDGGVKDYVSPVGNNDIPYPYIVLNSDCCIIKDNSNWVSVWPKYDEDKPINRDNLYYYYWKQDLQPNEKKIKVKSVIVDEVINNSIDNIRRGNWHYCEYDSEGNYIRDENKNNNYIKCYIPQGTSDMNSSDDESN
jgi:hypothetical protein